MKSINPSMGSLTEETDLLDPLLLPTVPLQSTSRPLLGDAPELPITKNAHKGLSGNGEVRSTIEVYDNGFFLLKTTVDANGRWSFTPGNALADGEHSYQIRAIDRAGNVGQFSAPYQFIVDTQAPVRPLISQLSDGDSALANGSATNNLRPTLGGDAEANSTVSVYGNGVLLGTTTADASGHWVFSPATSLTEQAYNFTVTATDRAGWVSPESSPVNVLLDATAPGKPAITQVMADEGPSGEISAGGVSHDTTPLFSGTAEARAIIKVYDGATLLGETDADSRGRWSFDVEVALATGSHNITVTATDAAGNTSVMSDAFTFSVELYMPPSAPSITSVDDNTSGTEVLIPNGGITKDGTPVLHGTAPAGLTVKVYDGSTLLGQTSVDAQGNWVFTVPMPLPEGTHTLTATSVDVSGTASVSSNSYQLTTDYTAPDKPLISQVISDEGVIGPVAAGESTEDSTPRVVGTAEANARITLYDDNGSRLIGETTADASGNWSYQIPAGSALATGSHNLTITATDAAGNTSVQSNAFAFSVELYVPPSAPSITSVVDDTSGAVQIPNGGATKDSTPVLHGTAPAGATAVKVYDGDMLLGQTQVNAQGNWVFTVPMQLSEGLHSLTAKSVDVRGTPSGPSNSYQLTTDYTAPGKPVISQVISDEGVMGPVTVGGSTEDTTPRVTGTAEANARITLYDENGNRLIGETMADASGNWSYQVPAGSALAAGSHSLTVTATDSAGNLSVPSNAFAFSVETYVPPGAPSITSVVDDTSGTVQIPNGGVTKDSTPVLHGTAPAGATAVKVYDGDTLLGQTQVNAQGNWVFTVPMQLSEGLHSLTAKSVDVRGTPSGPSNSYQLTMDYTAPDKPVINQVISDEGVMGPVAAGGSTEDSTPRVTGTAEANARIKLYDDNGSRLIGETTADASGNWSYQIPASSALTVGGHNLTVTATDAAGNLSVPSNAFAFSVEAYAPPSAPSITSVVDDTSGAVQIPNGGITKDRTPVLHGTAPAGLTVKVYDGSTLLGQTQADVQGNWIFTPGALPEGLHTLTARSVDVRGTPSEPSNSYQLTTDTLAPGKPVISQVISDEGVIGPVTSGGSTQDSTPRLTGTAEANARIRLFDDSRLIGETFADAYGNWSYQIPAGKALVVGSHRLAVTATDAAWNTSVPSNAFGFSVVSLAPPSAPSITSVVDDTSGAVQIPNGGITKDRTPVLHGTAPAGLTVKVYDGSTLLGQTQANAQGNWVFAPGALQEGLHTLTAKSVNGSGIASGPSNSYQLTTDYTAPSKPVISQVISDEGTTGPITAGGSTEDTTPRVTGTAEARAHIKLYDSNGSRLIGETDADAYGNWSYQIPAGSALATGSHNLTVTATDTVGNTSVQSDAFSFRIVIDTITTTVISDELQAATSGNVYYGNGFTVTANTALYHHEADPSSVSGLGIENPMSFLRTNYMQFNFNQTASQASFCISGMENWGAGGSIIEIYDAQGNLLHRDASLISHTYGTINWVDYSYTAPAGQEIKTIRVYGDGCAGDGSGGGGISVSQFVYTQITHSGVQGIRLSADELAALQADVDTTTQHDALQPVEPQTSVAQPIIDHHGVTYQGTAGSDVVNVSVDPLAYFAQQGAEIHGGNGVDTLKLTGVGQVIDLSGLTGFNDAGKISGIEKFDITGTGNNTLKISLNDVLNLGQTDLFLNDGNVQVMVNGNSGDRVVLSGLHDTGVAPDEWVAGNAVSIGGTQYQIYQNSTMHAELLVQNNVTIELM